MKLSDQFVLRCVCGEYLLVPLGEKTKDYNGVFTLSETGGFILEKLSENKDIREIAELLAEEFGIEVSDAYEDTVAFSENLRQYGILID